jgi:thiol-disulfide isomerase/thioredoxin
MSKNDEIIIKHRKIIARHKAELPMWYLELENKRLMVQGAYFKFNSLSYRKRMLEFDDKIPPHYVDSIVKNLPYLDERLMGFLDYSLFLKGYSAESFNPLNDTSANSLRERYSDSLHAYEVQFIQQPFGDYTLATSLSQRLRLWPDGFKPEWIELLSDTVYMSFLRKRLNGGGTLPKGAKAPNFTVLDVDSHQFHFSGTKDTVVLINFWSSYCSPCIDNFPRENELVERFKDEPVKIINLCIESEFWRFKMLVASNKLKTVNLFANKKMSSQLNEKFDISGIPHSILIDQSGLVVKNKCSVRGDDIVTEIEALLK